MKKNIFKSFFILCISFLFVFSQEKERYSYEELIKLGVPSEVLYLKRFRYQLRKIKANEPSTPQITITNINQLPTNDNKKDKSTNEEKPLKESPKPFVDEDIEELLRDIKVAYQNRNLPEAVKLNKRALEKAPNNYEAHKKMGSLNFHLKEYKLAVKSWEKSLALNPNQKDLVRYIEAAKKETAKSQLNQSVQDQSEFSEVEKQNNK